MTLDDLLVLDHEPRCEGGVVIRPFREYPVNWAVTTRTYKAGTDIYVDGDRVDDPFTDHYETLFREHLDAIDQHGPSYLTTVFEERYDVSFDDRWAVQTYQAIEALLDDDEEKESRRSGYRYATKDLFNDALQQDVQRSLEAGESTPDLSHKLRSLGFTQGTVSGKGCDSWVAPDGKSSVAIPRSPANSDPGDYMSRLRLAYENAKRRERNQRVVER